MWTPLQVRLRKLRADAGIDGYDQFRESVSVDKGNDQLSLRVKNRNIHPTQVSCGNDVR